MFRSFKDAEIFLQESIQKTKQGKIQWETNSSGDFIEIGGLYKPSFYLFGVNPPQLILRAPSEAYDLVIDEQADSRHASSLTTLSQEILQQLKLLF